MDFSRATAATGFHRSMSDFLRNKAMVPPRRDAAPAPPNPQAEAAWLAALKDRIAEGRADDPLIGPKIGAKLVNERLIAGLKNQKGVHIESFLTLLGALAGFSCQMSICEQRRAGTLVNPEGKAIWVVVKGKDGKKYYFGDGINGPLLENQYSIWSFTAGALQQFGAAMPDVNEIVNHVASTVGGAGFGVPRIPENHRPGDLPINYLKVVWPRIFPAVRELCELLEWPLLFGIAAQRAIEMGKDVLSPTLAATIVMECAIPMSKVDVPELNVPPFE